MDSDGTTSGLSTTDASTTSEFGPSGERRRVLKKRKPGERSKSSAKGAALEPMKWIDVLRRAQWGVLLNTPLLWMWWCVYDENTAYTTYGYSLLPYFTASCVIAAILNELLFLDKFSWLYYVIAFGTGILLGLDFSLLLEYHLTRFFALVVFGIFCGQIRYHWYKRRQDQYPTWAVLSAAFALGELLACLCTTSDATWYLLQTVFGYGFFFVAPFAVMHAFSKTMDVIRLCFGTERSLAELSSWVQRIHWLGTTVCSVGLLMAVGGWFLVWMLPFVLRCQVFLSPYACVLEMAAVESRRTKKVDKYSEVYSEHDTLIKTVLRERGKF